MPSITSYPSSPRAGVLVSQYKPPTPAGDASTPYSGCMQKLLIVAGSQKVWIGAIRDRDPSGEQIPSPAMDMLTAIFGMVKKFKMAAL